MARGSKVVGPHYSTPGVSKLPPTGQIRPAKASHSAAQTLCQ